MAITAQDVKELREVTGAGMMDCKKALTECDGDKQKAIDWLREKGIAKAAKKADRIAAEGLTRVYVENNTAVIFEVNAETDFVSKNDQFLQLLETIGSALLANKPKCMDCALSSKANNGKTIEELVVEATATIGEKISFRRFEVVEKADSEVFGAYMHMGGKISCVVKLANTNDANVAKDVAMHVAAMNPLFIDRSAISQEFIDHETKVQLEITKNDPKTANKSEQQMAGIVQGKLNKYLKEICLVDQPFFKDPDTTVGKYVASVNGTIASITRFAVGEGIEKRQDNFAEEVMNQVNGK